MNSSWESKSVSLVPFMNSIQVSGGLGNEAIEIGLFHANQEAEKDEGISLVILIGDEPANTEKEVIQSRNTFHGEAYWQNKFGNAKIENQKC